VVLIKIEKESIMIGKTIDEIKVGDTAEFAKTVSESDVYTYAGVTGDFNPAHIDASYAEKTFFKARIAHGMLSAGFISAVIGTKLPGTGTIYMKQDLKFLAPVRIGDTVTARVEVVEIVSEKNRVRLKTTCSIQDGTQVLDGEALVSPPKAPKE
jgi:3-hydroxybutyryl-CoA dehydratase